MIETNEFSSSYDYTKNLNLENVDEACAKALIDNAFMVYARSLRTIMHLAKQGYGNQVDIHNFIKACSTKAQLELFFESESFQKLSMNRFSKTKNVALAIQKKIGYELPNYFEGGKNEKESKC